MILEGLQPSEVYLGALGGLMPLSVAVFVQRITVVFEVALGTWCQRLQEAF